MKISTVSDDVKDMMTGDGMSELNMVDVTDLNSPWIFWIDQILEFYHKIIKVQSANKLAEAVNVYGTPLRIVSLIIQYMSLLALMYTGLKMNIFFLF